MFFKSENPVFDDMIQVSDYLTSTKILKSCDEFDFRDQHTEGDIRNFQWRYDINNISLFIIKWMIEKYLYAEWKSHHLSLQSMKLPWWNIVVYLKREKMKR